MHPLEVWQGWGEEVARLVPEATAWQQRALAEFSLALAAVPHERAQDVVAVREDVRLDLDAVTGAALGGEAPAVDARAHVLDDDPLAAFLRRHGGCR